MEVVKFLVDRGANIDLTEELCGGWTLLHYAAYWDKLEVVEFLIDRGANVYARAKNGERPVEIAIGVFIQVLRNYSVKEWKR